MAYFFSPFRNTYTSQLSQDCAFCDQDRIDSQAVRFEGGALFENEHYVWLVNFYPKFEGHTMIVPKRHLESVFDETTEETLARNELTLKAITTLQVLYPDSGIELFIQFGFGSASSVRHLHWHIVPAHKDDELRSFEKLGHFYTTEEGKEKIVMFPHAIRLAKEELRDALSQFNKKHR